MRARTAFTNPPPQRDDTLEVGGQSYLIRRVSRVPGKRKGLVVAEPGILGGRTVSVPLEDLRQYGKNNHYWIA